MNDMDSAALFDSEVFRNLVNIESQNEIKIKAEKETFEKEALQEFEKFQMKVNASPVLKREFKKLQRRFIEDSVYRESINQDFVEGVLLLTFED